MQLTGLDQVVAQWLPAASNSGCWLLVALVLATLVVGTFMSNTAAANLFLPIGLSSAGMAGVEGCLHPVHVAMSIALAASMSMALPISTPPNALAYAGGEFTTRDLVRVAALISGLAVPAIIVSGEWVLRFWGLLK
jgi:sodium-dependent dicarboxylate transporter 2/3/5